MEEFTIRLETVKDSYYGFVVAVLNYVKNNSARMTAVTDFMNSKPEALTSDILGFISEQPDFYDDAAYSCAEAG